MKKNFGLGHCRILFIYRFIYLRLNSVKLNTRTPKWVKWRLLYIILKMGKSVDSMWCFVYSCTQFAVSVYFLIRGFFGSQHAILLLLLLLLLLFSMYFCIDAKDMKISDYGQNYDIFLAFIHSADTGDPRESIRPEEIKFVFECVQRKCLWVQSFIVYL